jgi:S-adenosylmethionine hydrolase
MSPSIRSSVGRPASSAIVTLTTDFGLSEPFAGLVKAQVLSRNPAATIVDLTHGIAAYDTQAAAFWIERSYRYFPAGSLHVVVVDPGVGTSRRILAVSCRDQLFLGPDNGVLGTLAAIPGAETRSVDLEGLGRLALPEPSPTFHGRDLFGPLAGELSSGRLDFPALGKLCRDWLPPTWSEPVTTADAVHGHVIIVDRFGNCFSNIEALSLPVSRIASVRFGGHELALARTYGDRPRGSAIALVNAFGVLEAACVEERACERLAIGPGTPVEVRLRP